MLEAITKEEMTNQEGTLDIYAFMRSADIREYMRRNKDFSLEDKEYIILKSMNPMECKVEALELLSQEKTLREKERRKVRCLIHFIKFVLKEIYHPDRAVLYSAVCCRGVKESLNAYAASSIQENDAEYFCSYAEFQAYAEEFSGCHDLPLDQYEVDLVYPEKAHGENQSITFCATMFGEKLGIYAFQLHREWIEKCEFPENIIDMFWIGYMERYSLPFPCLAKIELFTPFMKEALPGVLYSAMDGCGSWYHFFYPEDNAGMVTDMMEFSCHGIEYGDLSIFDWVSFGRGEPSEEAVKRVMVSMQLGEEPTKIADLKPDSGAMIRATVTKVIADRQSGERPWRRKLEVELADDTGSIHGFISFFKGDTRWIEEYAQKKGIITIAGHFTNDKEGRLIMDYCVDVIKIKEESKIASK